MSLLDKAEKRPKRTLAILAFWTDFGSTENRGMTGVVVDGCENTSAELEDMCNDHGAFLSWVGEPEGGGLWKFAGHVAVYRSYEGEYDAEAIGEWIRVVP